MNKKHIDALGKVFAAEVQAALDHTSSMYQSKAKIYAELESMGMVVKVEEKFGTGWATVHCQGWELTHIGRMAYCATCEEEN